MMSSVIASPLHTNHSNMSGMQKVKQFVEDAVFKIAFVVFVIAHPIIGPLGSIGCLFKAAYHGIALNHHWRHTQARDAQGRRIPGTELNNPNSDKNYLNRKTKFKMSDLRRLQHEDKRLYHLAAAVSSLRYARGLAKCTIPIIGPFWAISTELDIGGSEEMQGYDSDDDCDGMTQEQRVLRSHIQKLKNLAN